MERSTVVAVYPPEAYEAVRGALDEAGMGPLRVRVDDPEDARWSLAAEQREEADRAFFAPQLGVLLPKESAKTSALSVPLAAALGAMVMAALAVVVPMGDLPTWQRALWMAAIGAAAAGTIAFIVTAAMASRDPLEPGVSERGVVIGVDDPPTEVVAVLVRLGPIRLDRISGRGQIERLATEEDRMEGGAVEQLGEHVAREAAADPEDRHR